MGFSWHPALRNPARSPEASLSGQGTRSQPAPPPDTPVRPFVLLIIGICLLISLVPLSPAFLNPTADFNRDLAEGSFGRQLTLSLLFLFAAGCLYRHRQTLLPRLSRLNPFLPALIVYCLLTTLWSPEPVVTVKRVIILIGLTLTALAVAPPIGRRDEMVRALRLGLTTLCVLSALLAWVFPAIGLDIEHPGAWRGLTWQKNSLGAVACYALLFWLYAWTRGERSTPVCVTAMAFCAFVLLMTRSSTALLLTGVALVIYPYWSRKWFPESRLDRYLGAALALGALLLVHFHFVLTGRLPSWESLVAPVAGLFGKGTDLTSRTDIWWLLLQSIRQHPWLGTGYGAFWLGAEGPSQYISDLLHWVPLQGHNGYLDILNELGVVGLGLFTAFLLWHGASLFRLLAQDRKEAALHMTLLCLILIGNVTESDFLRDTTFQNILLLFSSITVSARLGARSRQATNHPG